MPERPRLDKTHQALFDLAEIAAYYGRESVELELRFIDEAETAFLRLLEMPERGVVRSYRHSALKDVRMWPIPAFPRVLVFYLVRDRDVEVIRVLHTARDIEAVMSKRSPKRRSRRP